MNVVLNEQLGAELDALRDARTYKRFLTLESPQGPVVRMAGQRRGHRPVVEQLPRPVRIRAVGDPGGDRGAQTLRARARRACASFAARSNRPP